jgi:hypothetical protein
MNSNSKKTKQISGEKSKGNPRRGAKMQETGGKIWVGPPFAFRIPDLICSLILPFAGFGILHIED